MDFWLMLWQDDITSQDDANRALRYHSAVAVLWTRKIRELMSDSTLVLVTSTYGKNAVWYQPTFFEWCLRERQLVLKYVKQAIHKINKNQEGQTLLTSQIKTGLALEHLNVSQNLLEHNITWKCPKCEKVNPLDTKYCAECGTPRP